MFTSRLRWLLWLAAVVLWLAVWLFPESNGMTRLAGVILLAVVWLGSVALVWKRRPWRVTLLCMSAAAALFLLWPGTITHEPEKLRAAYLRGMARYGGSHYFWGGESPKGIDCSGLMRRGMIDGLFIEGCRRIEPALVRYSIDLWRHDCTAKELMDGYYNLTIPVLTTPSINVLDHSRILPGDMAVTDSGVHVMAYMGENRWIEADPGVGRVVTLTAPEPHSMWFAGPMKIVRWRVLQ
jgi:cell wall-associated NlpC family hydrolase